MARTKNTRAKEGTTEALASLTPAQKEALKALGIDIPASAESETRAERRPFMSCWTASKISPNARKEFTHANKRGETRKYRVLTQAQARAELDAQYAEGRVFAVPVA